MPYNRQRKTLISQGAAKKFTCSWQDETWKNFNNKIYSDIYGVTAMDAHTKLITIPPPILANVVPGTLE